MAAKRSCKALLLLALVSVEISTTTTTSTASPGWGSWGPWTECSKPCDYGLRSRMRTCGQLPCSGDSTSNEICALSNCDVLSNETDKGIEISIQSTSHSQDTMQRLVENQPEIDGIVRSNINIICSQNASLCCGFKIKSNSTDSIEFVTADDIYAARGHPKYGSDGTVLYKLIAVVNDHVYKSTCISEPSGIGKRQTQSTDPKYISFEVMKMAAMNSTIHQETGLVVLDYHDPAAAPSNSQGDGSYSLLFGYVLLIVVFIFLVVVFVLIIVYKIKMYTFQDGKRPLRCCNRTKSKTVPETVDIHGHRGHVLGYI